MAAALPRRSLLDVVAHFFPTVEAEDRADMLERINTGATADADYFVMMGIAAMLASFGLLQGSTAVIIGAMLVAPLMGPLVTAGYAITRGDVRLANKGVKVALAGIGVALLISLIVGMGNPGYEPTMELEARGNPDVLDLGIALASGMAAAYAFSRPNVASTLAGVAIAAALVPPLTVVGLAITNGRPIIAANATVLLGTNLVGIILGAALIFRLLGIGASLRHKHRQEWSRRAVMALGAIFLLLAAPLVYNAAAGQRRGQDRPLTYPVGVPVRDAVETFMQDWPDVEVIAIGRNGVEPEAGITILVSTLEGLPVSFSLTLEATIRLAHRGDPEVRVFAIYDAVDPMIEGKP